VVTATGTAGTADYITTTSTVTIPAGQTSVPVSVPTTDDAINELAENFTLNGTVTSGNTSNTTAVGTATITDNDAAPTASISDVTVTEGSPAVFTVSISGVSYVDTVMNVVTTTGTAGTADYTVRTIIIIIPAGQTSVTVSVPTTDDAINELAETFTLNGTVTSANTSNTNPVGTATINDNDAKPTVSISDVTVTEGSPAVFTVSISGVSSVDTLLNVVTTTGTAGTTDYTVTTTTVTIPAGQTSVTVNVPTTDDAINELAETFTLNGTVTSANTSNTNPAGTASINDNDEPQNPSIALIKTIASSDENGDGLTEVGEKVIYNFAITNTGNVALSNITISDLLPGIVVTGGPISLLPGATDTTAFVGTYVISANDLLVGSVTNQATVYGTSPDGVIVEDLSDGSSIIGSDATILGISKCKIEVFNAVSPNGDGENDVFRVEGLECYPENSVEIYNRWGVLVFEREKYNNDDRAFRGISEGRVTIKQSEELPVGTYFYIVKYKDGLQIYQKAGYLYVNRK